MRQLRRQPVQRIDVLAQRCGGLHMPCFFPQTARFNNVRRQRFKSILPTTAADNIQRIAQPFIRGKAAQQRMFGAGQRILRRRILEHRKVRRNSRLERMLWQNP